MSLMDRPTVITGDDMAWTMCGHDEVLAAAAVQCGGAGVAVATSCGASVVACAAHPVRVSWWLPP